MAVFPESSEDDWDTLLCTVSGQSLIIQTEALLSRKDVLQEMLGRISTDPVATVKADELRAARRELQIIESELNKFPERAKAVISTAQN